MQNCAEHSKCHAQRDGAVPPGRNPAAVPQLPASRASAPRAYRRRAQSVQRSAQQSGAGAAALGRRVGYSPQPTGVRAVEQVRRDPHSGANCTDGAAAAAAAAAGALPAACSISSTAALLHLVPCRLATDHAHLLQDLAGHLPTALNGVAVSRLQAAAVEAQAATAVGMGVALMQLCGQAQLPNSLSYRLASNAGLVVFTQGAHGNRCYLHARDTPAALRFLAGSLCSMQCTLLGAITVLLGRLEGGQQLQQLFGRTVTASPMAALWLASAAEGMNAACQQGEHLQWWSELATVLIATN